MEQKINEENIENNLVFCMDLRKAFAIKSMARSVFRNTLHQNKIRPFSISVKLWFRFLYKTMTKQSVYVNNISTKSAFRLQFLSQSAFKTHHCWWGLMTSPMSSALHKKGGLMRDLFRWCTSVMFFLFLNEILLSSLSRFICLMKSYDNCNCHFVLRKMTVIETIF